MLTVTDQYTRACLTHHHVTALSGEKFIAELDNIVILRGEPRSIIVDNGRPEVVVK